MNDETSEVNPKIPRTASLCCNCRDEDALAQIATTAALEISPRWWGQQETKDLIAIRGEMEKCLKLTASKLRNKNIWEMVAARMRDRGHRRNSDQCKCKWKNLLNRYKGKETSNPENGMECPFLEQLHVAFYERTKNMQRLLLETEAGSTHTGKRVKRLSEERSSGKFSEDNDGNEDSEEEKLSGSTLRKGKARRIVLEKSSRGNGVRNAHSSTIVGVQEMLKEYLQEQQRMEMQWREAMERCAQEQQLSEQEWQQSSEKLERERLMIEQAWIEREEQRRMREEGRAERRDTLLTTLLNKLIHENDI